MATSAGHHVINPPVMAEGVLLCYLDGEGSIPENSRVITDQG